MTDPRDDAQRRFADFLHRATPQPPQPLDADAIMRTGAPARVFRYWPQLAAAAVIVLVAAGTAVAVGLTGNDHHRVPPVADTSAPSGPSSLPIGPSSTPAPGPTPTTTARPTRTATVAPTVTPTATATPTTTSVRPGPSETAARPTATSSRPATSAHPQPRTSSSGPPACTSGQLSVTGAQTSGAVSHGGVHLYFRNRSSSACTLYGYPGVAAVDKSGVQYEQAQRTVNGFLFAGRVPHTVILRSGGLASAYAEGTSSDTNGDDCQRGAYLLVTPPNTTRATHVAFSDYYCQLEVHPVFAGE